MIFEFEAPSSLDEETLRATLNTTAGKLGVEHTLRIVDEDTL